MVKAETDKLCQMREILASRLERRPQIPDVVGDRRLLRFLRGHGSNVEKACKMYANFLEFRDANNVDDIRNDILFGHKHKIKTPFDFPSGKKILTWFHRLLYLLLLWIRNVIHSPQNHLVLMLKAILSNYYQRRIYSIYDIYVRI